MPSNQKPVAYGYRSLLFPDGLWRIRLGPHEYIDMDFEIFRLAIGEIDGVEFAGDDASHFIDLAPTALADDFTDLSFLPGHQFPAPECSESRISPAISFGNRWYNSNKMIFWITKLPENRKTALTVASIILLAAGILLLMGRTPFGPTGQFGFWSGNVQSQSNSQHLFDAYSLTHISHGLLFYLLLWWLFPQMSFSRRLILAVGLESAWEILENTDFVINRYRETTISLNYYGDSVVNTVGDILAAIGGFFIAGKISWKWSLAVFLILEILLAVLIRDNLILNIITLLFPLPAVLNWQQG